MHVPAFDLYYKYLYYQVVFARVNTWKVLRTSLHWSSWTELACFTGFTRFCPISLCVCMFIWVYICPCVYPTKKLAAWIAVVICGGDKYALLCFLELLQTGEIALNCRKRFGLLLWMQSQSLPSKLKQSGKLHYKWEPGLESPSLSAHACVFPLVVSHAVTWELLAWLSGMLVIICYLEI